MPIKVSISARCSISNSLTTFNKHLIQGSYSSNLHSRIWILYIFISNNSNNNNNSMLLHKLRLLHNSYLVVRIHLPKEPYLRDHSQRASGSIRILLVLLEGHFLKVRCPNGMIQDIFPMIWKLHMEKIVCSYHL